MNHFIMPNSDIITKTKSSVLPAKVLAAIKMRIKAHHDLYDDLVIKDKYWECILHKAFIDAGYSSDWTQDSHEIGKDITVKNLSHKRISCKSGMISFSKKQNKITALKISGFRTTCLKTLEDKLNHIDGGHEDVVYSLSSSLFKSKRMYVLTIFLPPKFKNMVWAKVSNGYKSSTVDGVSSKILSQCSDQLWYEIDYDSPLILEKYEISI